MNLDPDSKSHDKNVAVSEESSSASGSAAEFVVIEIEQQSVAEKGGFAERKKRVEEDEEQEEEGYGDGKICRVCHLSLRAPSDQSADYEALGCGGMEAIELGCGCKDDLAAAHRRCAETWFKIKGNRTCEICGKLVQNIGLVGLEEGMYNNGRRSDSMSDSIFVAEQQESVRFWHHRPICNFVLAFIVVILLLPWLFRIRLF